MDPDGLCKRDRNVVYALNVLERGRVRRRGSFEHLRLPDDQGAEHAPCVYLRERGDGRHASPAVTGETRLPPGPVHDEGRAWWIRR